MSQQDLEAAQVHTAHNAVSILSHRWGTGSQMSDQVTDVEYMMYITSIDDWGGARQIVA
ncbi:hypothetical protein Hypma_013589 [Hypsizygus marmoreus]|uniref:Uncharacterized protein n=1 Tax=Hypsizygus marmoreus TaxID=39966 RepID=A0A369JIC6_HYPMA|nr:hypothetical protein Hypma_013589 [Hypsizygus marmoreus]